MTEFVEIPASAVNPYVWEQADKMLAHSRKELRLPPVEIRWFVRADKLPAGVEEVSRFTQEGTEPYTVLRGRFLSARPGEIWVRCGDVRLAELLHTLVHECCHACAHFKGCIYSGEPSELLADEFAEMIVDGYQDNLETYTEHTLGVDYHKAELAKKREAKRQSIESGWSKPETAKSKRRDKPLKDITTEKWFQDAARQEREALRILNRQGLFLRSVPRAGKRTR